MEGGKESETESGRSVQREDRRLKALRWVLFSKGAEHLPYCPHC